MLQKLADDYSVVIKMTIRDMDRSLAFYTGKLGMVVDERYQGPWRQLNLPGLARVALGLWQSKTPSPSGGSSFTIVVENIEQARNSLVAKGVDVLPIFAPGQGVKLCYFQDPDGNVLALRQNSPQEPRAAMVGWQKK